ncbi:MAG: glycosyltransferase family 4 protein [Desulfuromonadaceae bacterium]|nr:glycosyltransferase family 4 protein [Desulfuromonadaceae bacterium]
MKIVFLAPFGIRPKGTVIARMIPLAVELQALGHEVVIVAPPYTNPEDSGKTENARGVRLRNIFLGPNNKVLATPVLTWRMFRAALAENPDLIHLFKPKGYGGLAAMLMIMLQRCGLRMPPLFVDSDDWEGKGGMNDLQSYSSAEKRLFSYQEQWLSRHAAGITVASRELQMLTARLGVAVEKILYLPNCVEDFPSGDGLRIRQKLSIGVDIPVVLLYTRFFEFSQERLHRVLAGIRERIPDVRFLIVGKGRFGGEELLLAASREMGFAESLIMAGWVEPGEIPDYLAAADVAIYPLDDTLVNRAKCPAKLTEIIRAGVPVVADAVGQALEYIDADYSGILCDPDDRQGMVERTVELLQDPARRKNLGFVGRRYLVENFGWRQYVGRLVGFYQNGD